MGILFSPRVWHMLLHTVKLLTEDEPEIFGEEAIVTEIIEISDPDALIEEDTVVIEDAKPIKPLRTTTDTPHKVTEQYSEEIMKHVEKIVNTDINEKTHPLIEIQHAIRMTGMWSSYHLELPKQSAMVELLKILFGKNQTRTRHLLEKIQEQKNDLMVHQNANKDGKSSGLPGDGGLQLIFPMADDSFLEQFHVEERDDMGVDISALDVIQKTFVKFPDFYFNPRIHCFSPFRNETILCSLRPAAF
uniref:Uncharacterized protein n=1 Tax=Paramoeba aestuarina TaxID=180227 RepID=A0A7S4KT47_9EUKA|mmetsp:Transcript_2493/g.3864  ORF Transcript_2493/g.3864 Transcript_2493/m.3864 type:complete len:246 (+) Transcript_2493:20-757(+)